MEAGCVVAAVIENATSGPQREPGSGDVLEGNTLTSTDLGKDDALPQPTNNNPTEEKQPHETSSAMVRSDITEHTAEPLLRSCVSTASMKVKNMKKLTFPRGHFPRLAECAHFHYETVDFGSVQLSFAEGQSEGPKAGLDSKELVFLVQITCQGRNWLVKRSYEDFRVLDKHLHLCIYDRRYSHLTELPRYDTLKDTVESVTKMLSTYLSRFSAIADNKINCGPVLTWLEIDNKGNHLLVSEEASINVPAIAAAHVTKRYTAQATDELTFEVGDIVSVIDMPPKEDTGWWRGKHGFQVGFFPCDCVELINDKIPPSVQSSVPKPGTLQCWPCVCVCVCVRVCVCARVLCKKHGKLVTFLRSFMKSRPPPQKLRQRGILRERVFGCDLGEHLHNSGHEVPQVVKSCAEFIEKHGVVDGIYRLSGISSNIQKLRHEFDSEQIPDLSRDVFRQDIHSVGSLCKLYFRELPNPLLTYQLYDRFSEAVSAATDEERLVKIHNVIQQLPPPHYRTLEFLMRHLSHLATFSSITNMHTKNLAIVWAPNLLRSRQIESACFSGTAAFMEVRIQSVVVEFILNNTDALFSPKLNAIIRESTGNNTLSRPKSLLVCSPSTKLLSLEEAQARTQAQLGSPATTPCLTHSDYIEVGEGPGALLGKFHTVIELPMESKRPPAKAKKSPVGNWLSFFHLGKSHSVSKRKLKRHPSEPNEIKSIALPGGRGDSGTLRSTKSEESLTSLHNVEGELPSYRPLRPRSTSEAISAITRDDLRNTRSKDHFRTPPLNESHNGADRVRTAACISPPHQEDDLDLCPPAAGISTLDFDPMSFQCSPTSAIPGLQHNRDESKWRKSVGCSSESEPVSSPNNISYSHMCNFTPNVSPLGSGSLDDGCREEKEFTDVTQEEPTYQSIGVSTPTQPACSAQSPLNSPLYVNTDSINVFNFRAVLAETSMPASVEEALPHPLQSTSIHHHSPEEDRPLGVDEDVYNNHRHRHRRPIQAVQTPAHHCFRPDGLPHNVSGPKSLYRQSSESRHSTLGLRHPLSPQYRRYHRDEQLSGSHRQQGQWKRSEDKIIGHPAIRRARSFHAPQISHCELAESEVLPPDTMFYVEQKTSQGTPYQRRLQTGIPPVRPQFENLRADYRHSPYSDVKPVDGSCYFVEPYRHSGIRNSQSYTVCSSRESGQSDYYNYSPQRGPSVNRELYIESRDTVVYEARDAGVFERLVYQPVKQESKSRHKKPCPVVSPYESPVSPNDSRSRDIMHTRSKSDPGNACLLSTNRMESQNVVVATSPTSQRAQQLDPVGTRLQRGHHSSAEPGQSRRIQIKQGASQQPPLRKVPSLPERGCPNLKNIKHNDRSHMQGHDQDTLMMTSAVNSYSGIVKPSILRRPGRSQSTRESRRYYHYQAKSPLDPEHLGSFSTQPNRRTQSTKVRPTQNDHMEGYYAAPKLKPTRSSKAMTGYLPGQSCMSPRGHRLLSQALGHEAFYHAALRSETGVYE
uniref:Rho GTPase activating protein 32a n=1 Tax=Mastacembelus armatus TaxID=205130 RepID=A0A7N9AQA9_9TELE